MTVKDLKSYQILNEKHVKELNSDGILLEHKKTGARVFLLSNDDENKVFCISSVPRHLTARVCRISWSTAFCAVRRNFQSRIRL